MGKKKVKPSAFGEFMAEHIKKEKRSGRTYPKAQWSQVAEPHWRKLSDEQKNAYKIRAQNAPTMYKFEPAKYTSQGVPIADIERKQQELFEQKLYMERRVRNMVEFGMQENNLGTKTFVFIMGDYFYRTFDAFYSPAELALAAFNFTDGVTNMYHTYVDPGAVTSGYAFEAKDRSEKVHRLPPPPRAFGTHRYDLIYDDILKVLGISRDDRFEKGNDRRPCVFILKDKIEMIESMLSEFSKSAGITFQDQFDVFELELLFNEMKNIGEEERIRIANTNQFLEQDRYDATTGISCDHHEELDVTRHCAMSYVRRWFFEFCDHVCVKIGIELVAGKHLPANALVKASRSFDDDDDDGNHRKQPKIDPWSDDEEADQAANINYKQLVENDSSDESDY